MNIMEKILQLHRCTLRFDDRLTEWGGALMALAIRLYVGWQFFKSGMVKLDDWGSTLALFQYEYHVPLLSPSVAAVTGAFGELFFPTLLAFGLLSRPAALGLFAVNLMAVISYPALFQFDCPAAINDHFYWGALLLALVAFGPGRFSLDSWLAYRSSTAPQARKLTHCLIRGAAAARAAAPAAARNRPAWTRSRWHRRPGIFHCRPSSPSRSAQ